MQRRLFLTNAAGLVLNTRMNAADICCGKVDRRNPLEIEGFTRTTRSADGMTHSLYRTGKGPAVFVCHELPGLYQKDIDLACLIADAGFTAYLPLFFGKPGDDKPRRYLLKLCLNPFDEFTCFRQRTSRAAKWLQAQMDDAHAACGGKGVGVIGMCLTGTFPLAVLGSRSVRAAVVCQPTMPFLLKSGLDLSPKDLQTAIDRTDVDILALKFSADKLSPDPRWDAMRARFKGRFHELILKSGAHSQGSVAHDAHSVLGIAYNHATGQPTRLALDRVIRFLDARLAGTPRLEPYPKPGEPCPPAFLSCQSH